MVRLAERGYWVEKPTRSEEVAAISKKGLKFKNITKWFSEKKVCINI